MRVIHCLILLLLFSSTLRAQANPALNGVEEVSDARGSTPVVLLSNGQVLEGTVKQEGSRIVIEQADGSKMRIATERVLCWGPDMQALHSYRVDHRGRPNLRDHLDETRWCISHGLYREAALELLSARKLSPHNSEALRLHRRLEEAAAPVRQVAATSEEAIADEEPIKKFVSVFATQHYTRYVQPILLNRCGACHDSAKPLSFTLLRLTGTSRVSAEMTHANMQRVLQWINTEAPMESPLLQYAQNPHGGAKQSPLGKTHVKALASLVDWVLLLSREQNGTRIAEVPTSLEMSPFDRKRRDDGIQGERTAKNVAESPPELAPKSSESGEKRSPSNINLNVPQRLPSVSDPFDPDVFNRRFHPELSD